MSKRRVLFICTENSARSQMAEGLLRHIAGDQYDVSSAGIRGGDHHPMTVRVMDEVGVDIRHQQFNHLSDFAHDHFEFIITLSNETADEGPFFPNDGEQVSWDFRDPSLVEGSEEEQFRAFRRLRHELTHRLRLFVNTHADDHLLSSASAKPADVSED